VVVDVRLAGVLVIEVLVWHVRVVHGCVVVLVFVRGTQVFEASRHLVVVVRDVEVPMGMHQPFVVVFLPVGRGRVLGHRLLLPAPARRCPRRPPQLPIRTADTPPPRFRQRRFVDRCRRLLCAPLRALDPVLALVRVAQGAGAPDQVVRSIRAIPPVDYRNRDEVIRSLGTGEGPSDDASRAAAQARADAPPGVSQQSRAPQESLSAG
jgi:hypothetical protein